MIGVESMPCHVDCTSHLIHFISILSQLQIIMRMIMLMVVVVEEVNKNSYMFGMAHQTKKNGENSLDNVYLGQDNGVACKEDIIVLCKNKDSNGCRSRILSSEVRNPFILLLSLQYYL